MQLFKERLEPTDEAVKLVATHIAYYTDGQWSPEGLARHLLPIIGHLCRHSPTTPRPSED